MPVPCVNRIQVLVVMLAVAGFAPPAGAQPPAADEASAQTFTLHQALQFAVEHYPSVRAAAEDVTASAAGVGVAKAATLPRLETVWQTNRATVNNVTGLLLPQSIVPGISGPPLPDASSRSAWGTAAGALFSWEPFDFGLRAAGVRNAEAVLARTRASEGLTRFELETAVATAFLTVVQAGQAFAAAEADVERRTVLARAARALVDNQLRPGAEGSRADAELAAARTRAVLARKTVVLAQSDLARLLGLPNGLARAESAALLASVAPPGPVTRVPEVHPLLQVRQAALDEARAADEVLATTNRPRLFLQSSMFARGSGAAFNGEIDGGASGLWFDRANWAAGFQVVFPNVFDLSSLRARREASAATARAASARFEEARLLVTSQQRAAAATTEAARAVAANTPEQVASARLSEAQASARYQAGLAGIVEVADAQSLLAQAEYQDALARVDVWRALLDEAVASGNLSPFRALAAKVEGVR
jgi:outer membrane protein TolC